jgi:site-specific recombinase XerC
MHIIFTYQRILMFYKNFSTPKSPLQWQEFRLDKFSAQLKKRSFSSGDSESCLEIVKEFLEKKHKMLLMPEYNLGLRLSEIRILRPTQTNWNNNITRINGKGKKDDMAPAITAWLKSGSGTDYLFEGYVPGKAISRRTIEKVYTNACMSLKIDLQGGIHSLRHSFASHLLEQGVDLRYIQELLGHASPKTTEIYMHVAANKIVEIRSPIAGLLRLQELKPSTVYAKDELYASFNVILDTKTHKVRL